MTSDFTFSGKVAVITGGGTGVGKATAKFLALRGCHLALLGRRASELEKAQDEIEESTNGAIKVGVYPCDIRQEAEVKKVFAAIAKKFGRIDFLVNNAGVNSYANLENITEVQIDEEIEVKSHGIIYCTREALTFMKAGSAIVIITSVNAFTGGRSSPAYPASNGLANTLVKYLAVNLAERGIRVNGVAPGFIEGTGFTKNQPSEKLAHIAAQNPMKRNCTPDDVAKAIYFLLSDLSAYVNGHTLHVNGGFYMN